MNQTHLTVGIAAVLCLILYRSCVPGPPPIPPRPPEQFANQCMAARRMVQDMERFVATHQRNVQMWQGFLADCQARGGGCTSQLLGLQRAEENLQYATARLAEAQRVQQQVCGY